VQELLAKLEEAEAARDRAELDNAELRARLAGMMSEVSGPIAAGPWLSRGAVLTLVWSHTSRVRTSLSSLITLLSSLSTPCLCSPLAARRSPSLLG
jgi:hypothetical protein